MSRLFKSFRPHLRPEGFSLLELICVIAILAIILGFAVPAVGSVSKGYGLSSSGHKVAQMIAVGRQNAVSKNVLTALVILTDHGSENDYRAFTLLEHDPQIGWRPLSSWETLATGVCVDFQNRGASTFLSDSPVLPGFNPNLILYQGQPVNEGQFVCRLFVPGGRLSNPEASAQIRLVEAFVEGKAPNHSLAYTRPVSGRPANYYDLTIVGSTGAVKIKRP